jgi:putative phosphoesterase
MRIAVLSDIHGNLPALDAVIADVQRQRADLIVNLGDIVSGPLQPRETADKLMALSFPTIRGNHERQLLTQTVDQMGPSDHFARETLTDEHLRWLDSLPPVLWLEQDVLMVHGTPSSDQEYLLETVEWDGVREATPREVAERTGGVSASLILCGHSHIPRATRTEDGKLIVNPGSVGLPAYESDQPFWHKIETGSATASYALVERALHSWSATLLQIDYDWMTAARLALDRNRRDWANALGTGRLK